MGTYERTKYEAELDARYEERFQLLQAQLFGRLHGAALVLSFVAGSAAFASALSQRPFVSAAAGLFIAFIGYCDTLLDFAGRAAAHRAQRALYLDLLARAHALDLARFDAELRSIAKSEPASVRCLEIPAFNDNLRSAGREDCLRDEPRLSRLARILV